MGDLDYGIIIWPMTEDRNDPFPQIVYGLVVDGKGENGLDLKYKEQEAYLIASSDIRATTINGHYLRPPMKYIPTDGSSWEFTFIPVSVMTHMNENKRVRLACNFYMVLRLDFQSGRTAYAHGLPFYSDYDWFDRLLGRMSFKELETYDFSEWKIFGLALLNQDANDRVQSIEVVEGQGVFKNAEKQYGK